LLQSRGDEQGRRGADGGRTRGREVDGGAGRPPRRAEMRMGRRAPMDPRQRRRADGDSRRRRAGGRTAPRAAEMKTGPLDLRREAEERRADRRREAG